tara:strand:+ start:180 stop:527 length:348 start_codon:yes stop_codon:yes gene_type:complete
VKNILYTTILVLLTPLFAQLTDTDKEISEQEIRDKRSDRMSMMQDSIMMDRFDRRNIYIADKIEQRKEKRQNVRRWIVLGGVAIVSYYAGWVHGKDMRKRKFSKGKIGDKDYGRY